MATSVDLYWWKGWGTCRTARAALSQAGIAFQERDFFKDRFSADELRALLGGESAREVFNFESAAFKKSELDPDALTDDQLFALLLEEPRYFRRPLVVIDGRLMAGTNAARLGAALGF